MGGGGGTGRALCRGCRCVGSGGGSEEDAGTRFRAKLASKRGKMRKNSFVGAKPYWPNGSSYFSCSVANKRPMDGQAKSQGQLNGEMAAEYSCPLLEAALAVTLLSLQAMCLPTTLCFLMARGIADISMLPAQQLQNSSEERE